ncbi:MAG: type III-A CRISPR-associated RAMP protein Csm4 [Candidatus Helarchaeota archaeon]
MKAASMKYKIIKLKFDSMVHFGTGGYGLEDSSDILHSDTIFGALSNAWFQLHDRVKVENFLKNLESGDVNLKISTAFPFQDDLYFLPQPCHFFSIFEETSDKELKKFDYLDLETFEKISNGAHLDGSDIKKLKNLKDKFKEIFKKIEFPKNAIDRTSVQSNIYYLEAVRFNKKAGLYFFYETSLDVYENWLKPALKFLQDEGFGGKRTWGLGLFKFEEDELEINQPSDPNYYMTLSLFYPNVEKKEEDIFQQGYWKLKARGGWIFSRNAIKEARRPNIRMIAEGSLFSKQPKGALVIHELKEIDHLIYRNGVSFSIPIKLVNQVG